MIAQPALSITEAADAIVWRTAENGKHFQIDTETGEIVKGNVGQENLHREFRSLEATRPDTEHYNALLREHGGDHFEAAKEFFRTRLQGTTMSATAEQGQVEVHFTGGTWKEIKRGIKSDPLKAEMVPHMPDIIATGQYRKRELHKKRDDGTVAFHEYRKTVQTSQGPREVIVDVAEREGAEPKFSTYNMIREGGRGYAERISHDEKESSVTFPSSGSSLIMQDNAASFDNNIEPFFEVVNLRFADEGQQTDRPQTGVSDKNNHAIAFDASPSARRIDENGYLHVGASHITKATVNPYYGREIPGWEEAGLEPDKVYYGLRAPEELEKSLSTWSGLPLHIEHHIDSAREPQKWTRVGAVGTQIVWNPPYVDAPLVVWDASAIGGIEDGSYRELSCAYRYEPDFTPGEFEGRPYDFVMRDIRGNHVALVEEGRAGPDVLVADANIVALDDRWITVKPNGPNNTGRPALIDENGNVKAGMGGKFNGRNIDDIPRGKNPHPQTEEKYQARQKRLEGKSSEATVKQTSAQPAKKFEGVPRPVSEVEKDIKKTEKELADHERDIRLSESNLQRYESQLGNPALYGNQAPSIRKDAEFERSRLEKSSKKRDELTAKLEKLNSEREAANATGSEVKNSGQNPVKPTAPEWWTDMKSNSGDGYWNGKFYSGNRVYVGGKERKLSDAQRKELETYTSELKKYKVQAQAAESERRNTAGNTYLNVPYENRELAKSLGAKWNPERKQWYMPEGVQVPTELKRYSRSREWHAAAVREKARIENMKKEAAETEKDLEALRRRGLDTAVSTQRLQRLRGEILRASANLESSLTKAGMSYEEVGKGQDSSLAKDGERINPIKKGGIMGKLKKWFRGALDDDPGVEQREVDLAQAIIDLHRLDPVSGEIVDVTEDEDKNAAIRKLIDELAGKLGPEDTKRLTDALTDLAYSKATGDEEPDGSASPGLDADNDEQKNFAEGVEYGEKLERTPEEREKLDREHESEGMKRAMDACGLDSEDPNEARAFAEGVKYGEEKGKAAADKPVEDEEPAAATRPAEDRALRRGARSGRGFGAMDAAALRAAATADAVENIRAVTIAAQQVRPLIGEVNPLAFDSARELYRYALKELGRNPARYDPRAWGAMIEVMAQERANASLGGAGGQVYVDKTNGKILAAGLKENRNERRLDAGEKLFKVYLYKRGESMEFIWDMRKAATSERRK